MKRRIGRKLVVFADTLSFFSGFRLFLLAICNQVRSVRYLSSTRPGRTWTQALQWLGLCSGIEKLDRDLTSQMPTGGCGWDWLEATVQTKAGVLVKRLLAERTLFGYLPAGIALPRQRAFLQKSVQLAIYSPLKLLLCCKLEQSRSAADTKEVALVNLSGLAPLLQEVLDDSRDVRLIGYADFRTLVLVRLVWFLLLQIGQLGRGCYAYVSGRKERAGKPATFAIQYSQEIDDSLRRSKDLGWYSKSALTPDQYLVFFDHPTFPANDQTLRSLKERGYRYRILRSAANATSFSTDDFPTINPRRVLSDLRALMRMLSQTSQAAAPYWQISRWLQMLVSLRRWQSLMETENIKVVSSREETGLDAISVAADIVGAIRIGYHWSDLSPNTRVVYLQQVYFVWGSRYQSVVGERLGGYSEVLLTAGCVFDDADAKQLFRASAAESRRQLKLNGKALVIGVLDRSLQPRSRYPAARHRQFYEALLAWAASGPHVGLIVKPKHLTGPPVFDHAPELASRLNALIAEGQAVLLEGKRSVVEVALASDVVVSLGYNSGGTIAALAGTRSVFWDPEELRLGPFGSWFRKIKWDNPNVVFTSMRQLIQSVELFQERPSAIPGLGDLSSALDEVDPFRDGQAQLRMGSFVRWFMEAIVNGGDRSTALCEAIKKYQLEWGEDKVCSRLETRPSEFQVARSETRF